MTTPILRDVGWPWTQDKMMVSCVRCGLGMFVFINDAVEKRSEYFHSHCVKDQEES